MPSWNSVGRKVADYIWQNDGYTLLSRATENWLTDHEYDLASDAVLEKFDRLVELVSKYIQAKIQDCEIRGVKPKYQFSSTSIDVIVPRIDTNEYALRSDFQKAIGKLSWRAFEHLCVHTMQATGLSRCEATPATRDQGIDFVGMLELKAVMLPSVWHDVRLRVLGQAKHYSSVVGEETVIQFDANMTAFSRGEGRAFKSAPDWSKSVYLAQVGFIFALTGFSQVARDYATLHSIMLKDGEQIVQDLLAANMHTPGLVRQGQHSVFDENDFLLHFEQYT